MRAVRTIAGVMVLLGMVVSPPLWCASLPDLIQQARPSIVAVGTAYPPRQPGHTGDRITYRGSGFVVGNGRQVITNIHVLPAQLDVENHESIAVFTGHGVAARAHVAKEVARDEDHDLVLLEFYGDVVPALALGSDKTVREGQDVAILGFPLGMALGLYPAAHRGIVAAITPMAQPTTSSAELDSTQVHRMRNRYTAYQLDIVAYPGNSGSPLIELEEGRVIGVVSSVVVKETRETMLAHPSGITYAIPVSFVEKLLSSK